MGLGRWQGADSVAVTASRSHGRVAALLRAATFSSSLPDLLRPPAAAVTDPLRQTRDPPSLPVLSTAVAVQPTAARGGCPRKYAESEVVRAYGRASFLASLRGAWPVRGRSPWMDAAPTLHIAV
jgi:hypothetical protein